MSALTPAPERAGLTARADELDRAQHREICARTDRLFALLFLLQWAATLVAACVGSSRAGGGDGSAGRLDAWTALGAGGAVVLPPLYLAWTRPGAPLTRHLVAASQLLYSALLIHLTGGRVEAQFHVFGSLACLAFYRDPFVFVPATLVVVGDHLLRSLFWPGSATGLLVAGPWSGVEYVAWLALAGVFLLRAIRESRREMRELSLRQAQLETAHDAVAREVERQTSALAENELQYRQLFEDHPQPMWVYDAESLAILGVNHTALATYGYTRESYRSMRVTDLLPPGYSMPVVGASSNDEPGADAVTMCHQKMDGTLLDVEVRLCPSRFRGRPARLMAAQDISRRILAERLIGLQHTVARRLALGGPTVTVVEGVTREVAEALGFEVGVAWLVESPEGVLHCVAQVGERGGRLEAFRQVTGRLKCAPGEELPGHCWSAGRTLWLREISDPRVCLRAAPALAGGLRSAVAVPLVGGERVKGVLEFFRRDPRDPDARILTTLTDIGRTLGQFVARRRTEERDMLLAALVEASEDAIIGVDLEGRVLSWNEGAHRLYGYTSDEIVGRPVARLSAGNGPGEIAEIMAALEKGQPIRHHEAVRVGKDGQERLVSITIAPMRDAAGRITGFSGITRDISEQRRLQARVARAQKLESIGRLAAGIAHEINTPTQFVGDNLTFLARAFADLDRCVAACSGLVAELPAGEPQEEPARLWRALEREVDLEFLRREVPLALNAAEEGVGRIARIVGAMKDFSHPGTGKAPADLNRAIRSTLTVARGEWKAYAEMVTELAEDLPAVPCVVGEINQVVLNLVINAAQALRDAPPAPGRGPGRITLSTRRTDAGVELRVSDNGPGIPAEIRERVFDPFFTTKPVGVGTGQGLAIAHDVVVARHGGTIELHTGAGEGTTFVITLPLQEAPREACPVP